jgi:hypothetical protein
MKDEEEEVDAREGACSIETAMARSCWQGAGVSSAQAQAWARALVWW